MAAAVTRLGRADSPDHRRTAVIGVPLGRDRLWLRAHRALGAPIAGVRHRHTPIESRNEGTPKTPDVDRAPERCRTACSIGPRPRRELDGGPQPRRAPDHDAPCCQRPLQQRSAPRTSHAASSVRPTTGAVAPPIRSRALPQPSGPAVSGAGSLRASDLAERHGCPRPTSADRHAGGGSRSPISERMRHAPAPGLAGLASGSATARPGPARRPSERRSAPPARSRRRDARTARPPGARRRYRPG